MDNDVDNLSLDLELVRDLTPEEMNGANGGKAAAKGPHADTSGVCIVATIMISVMISNAIGGSEPPPHIEPNEPPDPEPEPSEPPLMD